MPGKPPVAIAYCRVSTEGQAVEGVSLDTQKAKAAAWCEVNDHQLDGVFVDAGISGSRADNRPQLQAALERICKLGGTLIVYSLSRLARSTRDTIQIADRLDRAGANLVSLTERIDTTTAAGKMIFRMLAVLAEFEKDVIAERTSTALQHLKREGRRVGKIPFGFALAGDGKHLVEVAEEQAIISRIRTMRGAGQTFRSIADQLNADGVKTKQGGAWHHKVIRDLCGRG